MLRLTEKIGINGLIIYKLDNARYPYTPS